MFNEQAHHNSYKRRLKDVDGKKDYKKAPPPPSLNPHGEGSELTTAPIPDEHLYGHAAKPDKEGLDRMVAELQKAYVPYFLSSCFLRYAIHLSSVPMTVLKSIPGRQD